MKLSGKSKYQASYVNLPWLEAALSCISHFSSIFQNTKFSTDLTVQYIIKLCYRQVDAPQKAVIYERSFRSQYLDE